jgi:hypothetical protein
MAARALELSVYERISGRISGEVDPKDPRNAIIVDIGLAPVNARGMVDYSTDFQILRPADRSKGNKRLPSPIAGEPMRSVISTTAAPKAMSRPRVIPATAS